MEIDELEKKITKQLESGIYDPSVNQFLIEQSQALMVSNPETRSKFGPLIGKLKIVPKQSPEIDLNWVELLNGCIAIGHRPKIKMLESMKAAGTTHILTLLSEREGANEIGRATKKNNLEWIWLSLESAEPPDKERNQEIKDVFGDCVNGLNNGAKIYIHCSAGIHRTGMIAYALFRYIGFDSAKSASLLHELRGVTGREVGDHRKSWGDCFCNHINGNCETARQD